ncbi:MAG: flagellar motor switch protein FliN [Spirochaetota bacterium]
MSDGSLSQDEIDALLQGTGGMDFDAGPTSPALTDQQRQQFQHVVQGTVDSQQSNLSLLVNNEVSIEPPSVELTEAETFGPSVQGSLVQVEINLTEGTPGHHSYVMSEEAAVQIAGPMMGQEGVELDDAAVNALQEAFSQIAGPVITALGDTAGTTVMNDPPSGRHGDSSSLTLPGGQFVKLTYSVTVDDGAPFDVHEIFDANVVLAVLGGGHAGVGEAQAAGTQPQMAGAGGGMNAGAVGGNAGTGGMMGMQMGGANPSVQSVQFPNLSPAGGGQEQGNIGLLMDVYMEMTVELGRTRKLIKEILGMGEGTIIELDKLAGEPVDILVNHKLIAKGEVVVIDENFGVRVTEIVSPMERMSGMP